jgi:sec-independent protein translocase protein TatA
MGGLSFWHIILLAAVVMLLFGRGKISDLMGDVAQGINAFKKGLKDDDTKVAETTTPAQPMKTIEQPPQRVDTTTSDVSNKAV